MKQLYTIILICILALVQLNAQNPDSLKQALVKSKSLFSGYQTQTYYPESDCVGAIPICTDTFISTTIYNGRGYYQEINYLNSCLGVGEYRGALV
ncbi:MAG: hypothetical protein M0D57_10285 [Sphingobacteriales bacterium JAD_PAG50586_3]|nr:MAG: hypothetical protein M0D57_10285 [Sphingobacteriales bacterium JAD_PAG50586_3]